MPKRYGKPDAESPEWTREEFARAQTAAEVFPAHVLGGSKRVRGSQIAPTKQLVSLRVDRGTLDAYRATGPGWQGRINADLAKAAKRIPKAAPASRRAP